MLLPHKCLRCFTRAIWRQPTELAQTHQLPISQARVHLAEGDPLTALAVLEPLRRQADEKGWADERLKVMVLQAVAHHAHGDKNEAVQLLSDALVLAEPGGFIRIFVDEGTPMAHLLSEAAADGIMPDYTAELLAAFEAEAHKSEGRSYMSPAPPDQPLVEPLSQRELEVLQLIARDSRIVRSASVSSSPWTRSRGTTAESLASYPVQRRTEAVAKARSLDILPRQN